jgi:uroporphyrinogen decarboxylase
MTHMSKRERVDAALRGDDVDRVPVAAWRHFIPEERSPESLADISLRNFRDFDWDWIKVNPRSTYYAEAWGNTYDFEDYHGVRPRLVSSVLNGPDELERIQPLKLSGVFDEHLDLLKRVGTGIGDAHYIQTVFSPLSILSYMLPTPDTQPSEQVREVRYDSLRSLLQANPDGAHAALAAIAQTLAGYTAACLDAGASGLFFAIVRLARQGVLSREEYETFGKPYDLRVLEAASEGSFNMLHLCGPHAYFDLVADYPVHAINWATIGQHNPDVAEALNQTQRAVVGGVDEVETLQLGTPEAVLQQARESIAATGGRRLLLAPGCTTAMDVPEKNLRALRQAVEPA